MLLDLRRRQTVDGTDLLQRCRKAGLPWCDDDCDGAVAVCFCCYRLYALDAITPIASTLPYCSALLPKLRPRLLPRKRAKAPPPNWPQFIDALTALAAPVTFNF
jgi:hypothetical protein